jgi:hypothetical protein
MTVLSPSKVTSTFMSFSKVPILFSLRKPWPPQHCKQQRMEASEGQQSMIQAWNCVCHHHHTSLCKTQYSFHEAKIWVAITLEFPGTAATLLSVCSHPLHNSPGSPYLSAVLQRLHTAPRRGCLDTTAQHVNGLGILGPTTLNHLLHAHRSRGESGL